MFHSIKKHLSSYSLLLLFLTLFLGLILSACILSGLSFHKRLSHLEKLISSSPLFSQSQSEEESFSFTPPEIKPYTIDIHPDLLSPAGMTVNPEDKLEFKLKNTTNKEAIFKTNPDLGIDSNIKILPQKEETITFIAPKTKGKYKFIIQTSKKDLEGLVIVR